MTQYLKITQITLFSPYRTVVHNLQHSTAVYDLDTPAVLADMLMTGNDSCFSQGLLVNDIQFLFAISAQANQQGKYCHDSWRAQISIKRSLGEKGLSCFFQGGC